MTKSSDSLDYYDTLVLASPLPSVPTGLQYVIHTPQFSPGRDLGGFVVLIAGPDPIGPTPSFDYETTGAATDISFTDTNGVLIDSSAHWSATQWIGRTITITGGRYQGSVGTVTKLPSAGTATGGSHDNTSVTLVDLSAR
jgi:hypothetical protein